MSTREPIMPGRRVPPQFSWVDHRLVRDGHFQGRSATALALYLFLVTVADAQGLSWYCEQSLCAQLCCDAAALRQARDELRRAGLVAYRQPLYQVLDLAPEALVASAPRRGGEAMRVGDVLKSILGGAQ